MSESVLLHALSLNDRMLEPNDLPVTGRVWAYSKEQISREMFVGHCITMLSLFGARGAEINWKDDIMAFDVIFRQRPATVIISLRDDSLASGYFYFLGLWVRPVADQPARAWEEAWQGMDAVDDEERLLIPSVHFSVVVWDRPLQISDIRQMYDGDPLGQRIQHDRYYVYGQAFMEPAPSARFIICPCTSEMQHARFEVRHTLYSLRNLMALMGKVSSLYDQMQRDDSIQNLYRQMVVLLSEVDCKNIESGKWDDLICQQARIALKAATQTFSLTEAENEVRGLTRLFEAIVAEMGCSPMNDVGGLVERMKVPFGFVEDVLNNRFLMVSRVEKQLQILQPFMHSRMLASQLQIALKSAGHCSNPACQCN